MKYKLVHKTEYDYPEIVTGYQSLLCLAPRGLPNQECVDFKLDINPLPAGIIERQDFYGNTTHYFSLNSPHRKLTVTATSIVNRSDIGINNPVTNITCAEARELLTTDRTLRIGLIEYMLASPMVKWDEEVADFAIDCFPENQSLFESVRQLCQKIFSVFDFVPHFTTVNTPIKTVLETKKGVCQDFSHLAIASIRSMGFPVRYVSGYLETIPPKGVEKLQGSDASHAWISVFIPDHGWCDFDPTHNLSPSDRHIVTAWGRDYSDVPPMKGIIFSSGKQTLSVKVDVIPIE